MNIEEIKSYCSHTDDVECSWISYDYKRQMTKYEKDDFDGIHRSKHDFKQRMSRGFTLFFGPDRRGSRRDSMPIESQSFDIWGEPTHK